jgi:hypothetical protein
MNSRLTVIPVVLGLLLTQPRVPAQTEIPTTKSRALIVRILPTPARVLTDLGSQPSVIRGQLVFQQASDPSGAVQTTLVDVSLLGTSVITSLGPSGRYSLSLGRARPMVILDPASGVLAASLTEFLQYDLIGQVTGLKRVSTDHWVAPEERVSGRLSGRWFPSSTGGPTFSGAIRLKLLSAVLGVVREIDMELGPAPIESLPPPCGDAFGYRALPIQPVLFRTGPDDVRPTGRSMETLVEQAETIWNKGCVTLEVRRPRYINNGDLKIIDDEFEELEVFDLVDVTDAVEVYFVRSSVLGAATWDTGANAKIIVPDDVISENPPSENALAHELGHAMRLCHPLDGECGDQMMRGSPGTVMEPSGPDMDNPDLQSLDNCRHAMNSLFIWRRLSCCFRPDCDNDCR